MVGGLEAWMVGGLEAWQHGLVLVAAPFRVRCFKSTAAHNTGQYYYRLGIKKVRLPNLKLIYSNCNCPGLKPAATKAKPIVLAAELLNCR